MYAAFCKQNYTVGIFVIEERISIVNWPYILVGIPCYCKNSFPQILRRRLWVLRKYNHGSDQYKCLF